MSQNWGIVCIVHECQLQLYRHVVCCPKVNPVYWFVSLSDNPE